VVQASAAAATQVVVEVTQVVVEVTQVVVEVAQVVVEVTQVVVEVTQVVVEVTQAAVVVIQELLEEVTPVEAEGVVEASHLGVAVVDQPPQAEAAQQSLPPTVAES
jgi:hypothetical protein